VGAVYRSAPKLARALVRILEPQAVAVYLDNLSDQLAVRSALILVINYYAVPQQSRVVIGGISAGVEVLFTFGSQFFTGYGRHAVAVQATCREVKKMALMAPRFV
jgi:hypothetical protein